MGVNVTAGVVCFDCILVRGPFGGAVMFGCVKRFELFQCGYMAV